MLVGDIDAISEVSYVEWNIPSFSSLAVKKKSLMSPCFPSLGSMWNLKLCPDLTAGHFVVYLHRNKSIAEDKSVNFTFGIKKTNGTLISEISIKLGATLDTTFWLVGSIKPDVIQARKSELLSESSGTLTLTGRMERGETIPVRIVPNPKEVETEQTNLVELDALSSDFKDLLDSRRKYDVTINVQGKEFGVHRAVLSARSSVFRAMYEHDTSEDETGYLTIPDCDPESFGDFLNYIYTGKMEEVSFRTAYHLYGTAEKYDVQKLKSFCLNHVRQNLAAENVCEVVELADRYADDALMSSAQDFFDKNFLGIFQTSEWKALVRKNPRLVDKLLSNLSPAGSKSLRKCHKTNTSQSFSTRK